MRALILISVTFVAALLFGCGGGDSSGSAPANLTSVGTSVSLTTFKGYLMGTAAPGSQISFSLSGSDTQGNLWTGSYVLVSDGQTTFENQNVTSSRIIQTFARASTNTSTTNTASAYFLVSNGDFYKTTNAVTGNFGMPTAQSLLPSAVNVGDSGSLWTIAFNNGETESDTWKLDPEYNGNSKFTISSVAKNNANVSIGTGESTFYLDGSGAPYKVEVKSTSTSNGFALTLSGNKN